ncbi:MAG: PAS domain S-box protein [Nitrospirota bacterium]|mgnify:FL=1
MRDCYEALYDYSQAGFLRLDTQGKIVESNQTAATMLGINRKILIGQPLLDFIGQDDQETFQRHCRNVLKKDLRQSCEVWLREETSAVRLVSIESRAVQDDSGHIAHWWAMLLDITDRKRAGDGLKTTKEQLEQVLGASNTGLWNWNTDTNEMYFSREWKSQLGYGEGELADSFETWRRLLHSEDRESAMAYVQAYLKNPVGNYRQEFRLRHKDGSYRWIAAAASFLTETDGRQVRLSVSHTDITERKQLEAQFYQAQKMEAVGRFSASVAHDFNNLLLVINGYSKMLTDRLSSDDPRYKMAEEALAAGHRAAVLAKQLLSFSRRQVLNLESISFNDSIHSIRSMLELVLGKTVMLTLNLEPDLWSVSADKGQLDQVAMNLAINARDAMANGGELTITTRNVELTLEKPDPHGIMPIGLYVQLSIRDTGQGMSQETMSHLFKPFFTTKELGKGTGLGLASVYGIVKQSRGYIFVDSALGQGTTFHLYYPRIMVATAVAETATAHRVRGSETLLVVEDQDSLRSLIVGALTREGYRVIEAAKGEDALRAVATLTEPIHALVTAAAMPHMSGHLLAKRLRQVWPDLPVLFISGPSDLIQPALSDEPRTVYSQNPFVPEDLAEQIRKLLEKPI